VVWLVLEEFLGECFVTVFGVIGVNQSVYFRTVRKILGSVVKKISGRGRFWPGNSM
jgi:hypothetical protein